MPLKIQRLRSRVSPEYMHLKTQRHALLKTLSTECFTHLLLKNGDLRARRPGYSLFVDIVQIAAAAVAAECIEEERDPMRYALCVVPLRTNNS